MQQIPAINYLFQQIGSLIPNTNTKRKPEVVVLGSGWGASSFVENIDTNKYNVKVISTSPARLNQPRLIADFDPSYKPLKLAPTIDTCMSVNKTDKKVIGSNNIYNYEYLIIATGSEPNDFGIEGVKKHCFMFKNEQDLEILKNTIEDQTHITVLGAGPTGIELAFKLQLLGHTVTLIEGTNTILPGFSNEMQQRISAILQERNIPVIANMKITSIDETSFTTSSGKMNRNKVCIWTCGVRPTSFVRDMNSGKAFITDDNLMVSPSIYALGDVVYGKGPPTAQNAKQQGIYLANHFNNDLNSQNKYTYMERGRVIDIGNGMVVEYQGRITRLPYIFRNIFYAFVA